jgi:predicted porin
MNRKLLAAAVAGVIAPMAAPALDVAVNGQINRAIRFADNGANSDVQHIDGSAWGSRFRITASGELMEGITAGANIEQEFATNRGWEVDVDAPDAAASNSLRHSYLHFSGNFGTVKLGNTDIAGASSMWVGFNDAYAGTEYSADTNSGISVMTADDTNAVCGMSATTAAAPSATHDADGDHVGGMSPVNCTVASFFPGINNARANVLRYDSPSIGPVSVQVSVHKPDATDHQWNFGGRLNQDFGPGILKMGVILAEDVIGIGGGIGFANGTAVNAAWGNDDRGGKDFDDIYASVTHKWGSTTVALGYHSTDNNEDMEGRAIGLGVNHSLGSGVDVYAGFNNYSFDKPGMDLEDVTAFHIGTLVTFN